MDEKDFRIQKYMGKFIVQRKFTKHCWYSSRIIESWERTNMVGGRSTVNTIMIKMLSSFDSLDKARKWVKDFLKNPIYYEI